MRRSRTRFFRAGPSGRNHRAGHFHRPARGSCLHARLRVALKKPLSGVTTLEAMAAATGAARASPRSMTPGAMRPICCCGKRRRSVFAPAVMPFAEAWKKSAPSALARLSGTGAPAAATGWATDFILTDIRQPDALWVARLALRQPASDATARAALSARAGCEIPRKLPRMTPILFDPAERCGAAGGAAYTSFRRSLGCGGDRKIAGRSRRIRLFRNGWICAGPGGRRRSRNPHPGSGARARGQGLGRALSAAAAGHAALGAENIFLEVGADNPAALALYAGLGFVRVGQRKAYYRGEDALVLKAGLPLSSGRFRLTSAGKGEEGMA